jgi:soluble lytic murein transglycosylase-like protein
MKSIYLLVTLAALVASIMFAFGALFEARPLRARERLGWLSGGTLLLALSMFSGYSCAQDIPRAAHQYQRALTANARMVWGLNAPVATFAGQVHQESAWRPNAQSPFASGLAQFTPATAEWIGGVYADLADPQPFNAAWALRALVRYDRWLWDRNPAATDCDRMSFALVSYNGGEGWLRREQKLAASKGSDPKRWFSNVELWCMRSVANCHENRDYPRKILLRHQRLYASWGPAVTCS